MDGLQWKTGITSVKPNELLIRGYPVEELMGHVPYSHMIYLVIKGELPSKNVGKLIDAMLVSSVDHGATPPSVLTSITVASTGAPLNACLASGILAISRFHGGAIEGCMETLMEAKTMLTENRDVAKTAEILVENYRTQKKRIPGFGHRLHTRDPRTIKLFQMADELGISGDYVALTREIEKVMATKTSKTLPINVDGAIAALLCELEFPPHLANGFFIMARIPGLIAHVYEEKTRFKPMRRIHPVDHEYDGPGKRTL